MARKTSLQHVADHIMEHADAIGPGDLCRFPLPVIVTVAAQTAFKLRIGAAEAQPLHQITGEDLYRHGAASSDVRVV